MKYSTFIVAAAAGSAAAASAPAYAQCGGNGFSGATDCVAGYHCAAQNEWYSQCVPGAGSGSGSPATSAKPTTTQAPSKAPVTTSKAVVTSAASSAKGKVKVRAFYIDDTKYQKLTTRSVRWCQHCWLRFRHGHQRCFHW